MFMYVFSIALIVISNIFYNICQKSIPGKANPLSSLIVTYFTAAILSVVAFIFTKHDKQILNSFRELNWTSVALGFTLVGLELGYLMAYRVGWNISVGSLVANIILAIVLIPIGIVFYKEGFELNKIIGIVFCIIGLILINRK